jgi:hypothetical protein
LKKFGPKLNCVVTLTEELALSQAGQAEREIRAGKYRGALHGIPWGAKDLFATKGILTTWGAEPYREQVIDYDATVVERLREAGAVLVAKLSMGALAQGGRWFGGMTRNPWQIEEDKIGSSGSSAGPAAATAAGLVGFSIVPKRSARSFRRLPVAEWLDCVQLTGVSVAMAPWVSVGPWTRSVRFAAALKIAQLRLTGRTDQTAEM